MMQETQSSARIASMPSPVQENSAQAGNMPPVSLTAHGPAYQTEPEHVPHHHEVLSLMQTTLTFLVCALFVLTFIAQPYRIPSRSMENTLLIGDFLLVNKVVFASPGPWRHLLPYQHVKEGDVVVFHYPMDHSLQLVKRVLGVPGARIRLHHGRVLLNGQLLPEPYALYIASYPSTFRDEFPTPVYTDPGVDTQWWMQMRSDVHDGELTVPAGEYFVLGDNRNDSLDSRYWGFVPRKNIVGQPFLVYFSVLTEGRSELTGMSSDRLAHEHSWWSNLVGAARWGRTFHIIR
ncbi:MAG TPA: signal peptidase I [Acidobacteriaceae bacterium]|nr:signal peptidase I [Acidobacteriaceae bacterium]